MKSENVAIFTAIVQIGLTFVMSIVSLYLQFQITDAQIRMALALQPVSDCARKILGANK